MQRVEPPLPLLPDCEHLRVRSIDARGVWSVKISLLPWRYRAAAKEREAFLARLSEQFPFAALWRGDGAPDAGRPGWESGSAPSLISAVRELDTGGWALFFFSEDPHGRLAALSGLPTAAPALLELLEYLRSRAVIVSWYDDNEWLVAAPRAPR